MKRMHKVDVLHSVIQRAINCMTVTLAQRSNGMWHAGKAAVGKACNTSQPVPAYNPGSTPKAFCQVPKPGEKVPDYALYGDTICRCAAPTLKIHCLSSTHSRAMLVGTSCNARWSKQCTYLRRPIVVAADR